MGHIKNSNLIEHTPHKDTNLCNQGSKKNNEKYLISLVIEKMQIKENDNTECHR